MLVLVDTQLIHIFFWVLACTLFRKLFFKQGNWMHICFCGRIFINMTPVCPFVKAARPDDNTSKKSGENSVKHQVEPDNKLKKEVNDSASASPKCPFGYDTQTFKIGPLSCMICQALLFESSRCVPCSHVFCKYLSSLCLFPESILHILFFAHFWYSTYLKLGHVYHALTTAHYVGLILWRSSLMLIFRV